MKGKDSSAFVRSNWATSDGLIQTWVNDLVWKILDGPKPDIKGPPEVKNLIDPYEACRQVLVHNELLGMALCVFEDALKPVLGNGFYGRIETDRRRTDIFLQELNWLLQPSLGGAFIVIGDAAMRKYYDHIGEALANPRFIQTLTLWTPTLAAREGVTKLLEESGYEKTNRLDDYHFSKVTQGITHGVQLRGVLWEGTKNWSLDVERAIWDRARENSPSGLMDDTDQFILACRFYAIDSLLGSAVRLLDLTQLLGCGTIDWVRVRAIKDQFLKPDWFWAALLGVAALEGKTSYKVDLPAWVREGLKGMGESFWKDFLDSRLCWANPDGKLVEFSRAYVKLSKGT